MKGTGKKNLTSAAGSDLTLDREGGGGKKLLSPHNLYTSFMWKKKPAAAHIQLVAHCKGPESPPPCASPPWQ